MHGRKKWIVRFDGRLKRSRHGTSEDWRSGRPTDFWPDCPDCARRWSWGSWCWKNECDRCRWLRYHPVHGARYRNKWACRVQADEKRQQLREYRAEVRNIMQRAKFDPDLYDLIPPLKRPYLD